MSNDKLTEREKQEAADSLRRDGAKDWPRDERQDTRKGTQRS